MQTQEIQWFTDPAIWAGYTRGLVALGIVDAEGRRGYALPSALDWDRVAVHPVDGTEWQKATVPGGAVVWRREAVRGNGRGLGWEMIPAARAEAEVAEALATREALADRDYAEAVDREASEAAAAAAGNAVRAAVAALFPATPDAVLTAFVSKFGHCYEVVDGVLVVDGWSQVVPADLAKALAYVAQEV